MEDVVDGEVAADGEEEQLLEEALEGEELPPTADELGEDDIDLDDIDEAEDVEEHLKEAVEGSFKMKRLLEKSADDEEEPNSKKPKTAEQEIIQKILTKWGLTQ